MAFAANITTDKSALLALKAHITNDPYGIITNNWSTTSSVCNWVGIGCSIKHNRVTSLNFSYMDLTGSFPPEIGTLSFLTYVIIMNNSFHGPLPIELIYLPRLKLLNIAYNDFSGEIPSWLGRLQRIEKLYLLGNQFSGPIPTSLFNLTSLQILNLRFNQLSGGIPREVGNLTMLESLYLHGNQLTEARVINEITLPEDCEFSKQISFGIAEIPSEIGKLRRLKKLDLEMNLFSGPIPSVIFNLSSLVALGLTWNNFTGWVPDDICENLPALEGLYLSDNQLSGGLPSTLWRCENLRDLSLSNNQFTGSVPRNFGNLSRLTNLFLGANYLSGEIPYELGYLQNLKFLGLQMNFFNGTIPSAIFNLSNLATMALIKNQLSGTLPPDFGVGLPNLVQFTIGLNKLTGTIPESISNASMLTLFDISANSFSGLIPTAFGKLKNLQWFGLQFNNFTTESLPSQRSIFSFLTNLTSLVWLELSHNPLNIFFPSSIGNFSASLQYISMVNAGMKGQIPKDIGNLRALTVLAMDDNEIIGNVPASIGKLKQLQGLHLSNNNLEGIIPMEFCQLTNLIELFLGNNKLSGSLPACFDKLSSLRTLSLSSNNFNSTMPSSLWSLSYILHLNLSSNSLSGSLPADIGNLKVVLDIDLSKNKLSGEIPSSIGGLADLVNLSVSHNELQGSIPNSFGNLVGLKTLDLSSNNLTGVIPKSLEKLSRLEHFNVSFNQLEGEIPNGGPFSNFSAQSFISNRGLCAASSRLQVPPCTTNTVQRSRKKTNILVFILVPTLLTIFLLILVLLFFKFRLRGKKEQVLEDSLVPYQPTWRRTTYREISQATQGFSENNLVGRGNFGSVYKATLSDGTIAAVKVFNLLAENAYKSFEAECEILCNIHHRNLVKIITNCSSMDFKALVLEFMPNGSLEMWLYHQDHCLNILERLNIMVDVASALDYLHHGYGKPIVHCDLKPSNILLDGDMVAHLTDFGISKLLGGGESVMQTMTLATVGYMAPELGLDGIVSRRGDVYSYGILLMETFTGKKPTDEMFSAQGICLREWVAKSYPHSVNNVVDSNLLMDDRITYNHRSECLSSIMLLALSCTVESPEKRASSKEILDSICKIKANFLKNARC
ncbi:LRR receptor-like serine/threonine-protein kinase EFR [Momordica charantia]|uniref:non-specific serine/threonine protein kinase n=1 Tax=Momordica charantia TaxID=3673 RepID=A0A6J1CF20_MOMCH|nr:LRR receptor-like serine/threonine-protein kinase EFR [Momordica charantia]